MKELTKEELRVRAARLDGWGDCQIFAWDKVSQLRQQFRKLPRRDSFSGLEIENKIQRAESASTYEGDVPNYPEDLNACAELRASLTEIEQNDYVMKLMQITNDFGYWGMVNATAEQHCRAFLAVKEGR